MRIKDFFSKDKKEIPADFFVVGFSRCGTTSLRQNLNKHPEINCLLKENNLYKSGEKKYTPTDQFVPGKLNGEGGPNYVCRPEVMKDISKRFPNSKIIICIRFPVQGYQALYNLRISSIASGKQSEREELKSNTFAEFVLNDEIDKKDLELHKKCYINYIRENVEPLFSKEQVLILVQEEMYENIEEEMRKVFEFLNVSLDVKIDYKKRQNYDSDYRYKNIDYSDPKYPEALKKIMNYYHPYNIEIQKFLNRDIVAWKSVNRFYKNKIKKKDNSIINIFGHRRSGNHFLMKELSTNFFVSCEKRHLSKNEIKKQKEKNKGIYIIRDPRDVLISNYKWWKTSGESRVVGIYENFKNVSLSEYLRGNFKIEGYKHFPNIIPKHDIENGIFSDPVEFWAKHVQSYEDEYEFVRFEDLLIKPQQVLEKIHTELNLEKIKDTYTVFDGLVGHQPNVGKIGGQRDLLSKKDEEYIYSKIGNLMDKYGYKK